MAYCLAFVPPDLESTVARGNPGKKAWGRAVADTPCGILGGFVSDLKEIMA